MPTKPKNWREDEHWREIGRYNLPGLAINAAVAYKVTHHANYYGRVEEVPSRSRAGQTSWAVFVKAVDEPKQSLDVLESWYVGPDTGHGDNPRRNPRRRSRRPSTRRRTSRRRTSRR